MSFGQLVPGMQPMPIPSMQPNNQMMQLGMQAMQQARAMQRPGQPPQGLLQRLLNPAAPAPTDLAAPGLPPNAGIPGPGGNAMQMGMLAKLFPGLAGGQQAQPMGGMAPGPPMPQAPPNALGGLY